MNKKEFASEYQMINKFVNFMLQLARYVALFVSVVSLALTMFLTIMLVMKGKDVPTDTLADVIGLVTNITVADVTNYVATLGTIKVTIAFIGYYAAIAISTGLMRVIFVKFRDVFNAIINGNAFEQTTLETINSCIPVSILLTFVQPIILVAIILAIGIFDYNMITVTGITYLAISYVGKLLIENGYSISKRNNRLAKEISDIKAYESEVKMSILKKQAEAKKNSKEEPKKKVTRKTTTKRVTKKATK